MGFLDYLRIEMKWILKRFVGLKLVWVNRRKLGTSTKPPELVRTQIASYELFTLHFGDPSYRLDEQAVSKNFAGGDVCVVTFLNDQLAAYSWVRYKPLEIAGGEWADFSPGHRYSVWGYTHPDFRGRHIRGSYGALDELDREHAITHTISYIETHNFSSLKAEARHGGEIIGIAGYIKVFGRFFSFRSPGVKRCGFKLFYSNPI